MVLAAHERSRLTFFQLGCLDMLEEVIHDHEIDFDGFVMEGDQLPWLRGEFVFQGKPHRIEFSHEMVVMFAGPDDEQLFEPYLSEEFKTDRTLAEGFASRLGRYLGGGEWAGPDEPTFWEMVRGGFRKLFRRS